VFYAGCDKINGAERLPLKKLYKAVKTSVEQGGVAGGWTPSKYT
jgi:hypothetical protein